MNAPTTAPTMCRYTRGGSAADVAGSNGVHLEAVAGLGGGGSVTGGQNDTGKAAEQAHVGVDPEEHLLRIDTAEAGSLGVTAHGVDLTTGNGLSGDEVIDRNDNGNQDQHDGDTVVAAQLVEEEAFNTDDDDVLTASCQV